MKTSTLSSPLSMLRRSLLALALPFFLASVFVACGDDTAGGGAGSNGPLDTKLDVAKNVVSQTPQAFAPVHGGIGQGKLSDGEAVIPTVRFVFSEAELDNVGETNCGQFVPRSESNDLELTLYAALAPGEYEIVPAGAPGPAGKAQLRFGTQVIASGKLIVEAGAETRGTSSRGRIQATTQEGAPFAMTFETLFHGCGRGG